LVDKDEKKLQDQATPEKKDQFPSLSFLVNDNDLINVAIDVVALPGPNGTYIPRCIDLQTLTKQKDEFKERIAKLETELTKFSMDTSVARDSEKAVISGQIVGLTGLVDTLDSLLNAPCKSITATFKLPSWKEHNQIYQESYAENTLGNQVFSMQMYQTARMRILLKAWDLTQTDVKTGRDVPIPISQFEQVAPDIIEGLLGAYDKATSATNNDLKK